ncbi:zwei Ig domain protein zig-8-like [Tachypleus tridentatus]|uniref:zwei Ig domain protein zig-8-like n=1 Tax=Tachypleus tridentatus TaxID=6853 RepID=UPI003FD59D1B
MTKFAHLNIIMCHLLAVIGTTVQKHIEDRDLSPDFMDPIPNVTVTVGHDAAIPCTVENLGFYRVAWLRVESKTILTIHHNVITRNYRVNLSYTDHKKWILHIKNAQESDRGLYMCQINTVPMKSQIGYLDVVGPVNSVFFNHGPGMNYWLQFWVLGSEGSVFELGFSRTFCAFMCKMWQYIFICDSWNRAKSLVRLALVAGYPAGCQSFPIGL